MKDHNHDAIINLDPKDNLVEDMEVDNLKPSPEDKDTDFNEDLGIQEYTEDRNQNSMMTLPNTKSDTAVKATKGLEEQSEQPIQMSETLELEEVDEILNSITNEYKPRSNEDESQRELIFSLALDYQ